MTQNLTNQLTTVESLSPSEYDSDLLELLAQMAASQSQDLPVRKTSVSPQKKGELLTGLVLSLVSSAVYDLLKEAAKRLVNHPGRPGVIELGLNGTRTKIDLN